MNLRFTAIFRRVVTQPLEAAVAFLFYVFFRLLPLDWASVIGGFLGRTLGPILPASRRARRNLAMAFPDKPDAERATILSAMWDNLGRVAGEVPHLARLKVYEAASRVDVRGAEALDAIRDAGKPVMMFGGHFANWEILPYVVAQRGVALDFAYRQANNPYVERLYQAIRKPAGGGLVPKGAAGARQMLKAIDAGRSLGFLIDQKMNDGIAVPFFGCDAMTATAMADFALRCASPVVPVMVERLAGAHFRVTVCPPLEVALSGERHVDVAAIMTAVNATLEDWIRARPAQWLWLHNRWPE
jgi:KDO2-lipid IV(A) lauroyltransferase